MTIVEYELHQYEQNWVVTGYCGCYECCGKFALNREEEVYGAYGTKLIPHYSCASDLPFGTKVEIKFSDGSTQVRRVDDVGGLIHGNHLDLYESSHEEALEIGYQIVEVRIIEGE